MTTAAENHAPARRDSTRALTDRAAFVRSLANVTDADLPSPNTKRWVIRRKAEVVAGVRNGVISLEEACRRYKLSMEEFLSWQRLIERHGLAGLRATRLQDYRSVAKTE